MANRSILYTIRAALAGGHVAVAEEIALSLSGVTQDNVSEYLNIIGNNVQTLQNTAFSSGRSFVRFNDGFTIDETNLGTFEDKNIIYTARNDKPTTSDTAPDVVLPTDAQIALAGEPYPVVFEFTHLGGSARFDGQDINLVRIFVDGSTLLTSLRRDEVAVISKSAAGQPYEVVTSTFDAADTLLPEGVFNLKTQTTIDKIDNIATDLSGVNIVAGDAYLVETGGNWSGYVVEDDSVLVALKDGASLVDNINNTDWLLLENTRARAGINAFFANFTRDGITYQANRNIRVDPSNVLEFTSQATGVPLSRQFAGNTQGSGRQIRYDNVPLQLSDIQGGRLSLSLESSGSTNGFPPVITSIQLYWSDEINFVFPISNGLYNQGSQVISIDIPNLDYSSAFDKDVSLRINYDFNGVSFNGNLTISDLVNTSKGSLHDAILTLINLQDSVVRSELNARIDSVIGQFDNQIRSFDDLADFISPRRELVSQNPDPLARFANSTGSDNFPSFSGLSAVPSDNPIFTISGTALYVAVIPNADHALRDTTTNNIVMLDNSEPSVTLGESLSDSGQTYFVYRVTGLTANNSYEVVKLSSTTVAAWGDDIDKLKSAIERLDSELEHAVFDIPDSVVNLLKDNISVTEETSPTYEASDYNRSLGSGGTAKVSRESNPKAPSAGVKESGPISGSRNKLLYLPSDHTYTEGNLLTGFDGTTETSLLSYSNGQINAKVFVPARPAGTHTESVYLAPSNRVSGNGIWQTIETLTFIGGVPSPEADELFFTRNLPTTSTTLNIQYRGHANGNIFGSASTTLDSVGGTSEVARTVTVSDGSETATVEIRYYPNLNNSGPSIRVSVTERVSSGLPTIQDVQVILSFSRTVNTPAIPASVREVSFEQQQPSGFSNVVATKQSSGGTLVLVGDNLEVDTNYQYTTLFGSSENGNLRASSDLAEFFDYTGLDVTDTTVLDLENHSNQPQFGLFDVTYTGSTVADISATLKLGGLRLTSPNNSVWDITVDDLGNITATEV